MNKRMLERMKQKRKYRCLSSSQSQGAISKVCVLSFCGSRAHASAKLNNFSEDLKLAGLDGGVAESRLHCWLYVWGLFWKKLEF